MANEKIAGFKVLENALYSAMCSQELGDGLASKEVQALCKKLFLELAAGRNTALQIMEQLRKEG